MMDTVKTKDIALALHLSRKGVLEKAQKEKWVCVRSGNALRFIEGGLPVPVRFALAALRQESKAAETEADVNCGAVFANAPEKARETAVWRSSLIFSWRKSGLKKQEFVELYNQQCISREIYKQLGSVSIATFYRWVADYRDDGASGITPKYGLVKRGAGDTLSEAEKDNLQFYWLQNTQPSASHAYRSMQIACPYSTCTYQTALRYLNSIPPVVRDYFRMGQTRFENSHLPYVEQDVERYKSLDCVVSDHHCLDCVVMYHGRLIRPWITTFQDYRSGKILGWCPCVTPSSYSIIVAYYMVCYFYGVPVSVLFDNGKDYHSKLLNGWTATANELLEDMSSVETEVRFQGVFQMIGSEVHFTRVYNGKSKGRQERYFRILGEYLAKDIGTYVGSDTKTRPDDAQLLFRPINGMAKRNDVPDWDTFRSCCNSMVQYINDTFVTQAKGCKGLTRSAAFQKFLPEKVRHVDKATLQAALSQGEVRKVNRNGINIKGVNYWSSDLLMYVGQDVLVRTSLVFDNKCLVFEVGGKKICECEGSYFMEDHGNPKAAIDRVSSARKAGFAAMAEIGSRELSDSPDRQLMLDTARNMYSQNLPDIDEVLGEDGVETEPVPQKKEKDKEHPVRKLKGLLDEDVDDYKPDVSQAV